MIYIVNGPNLNLLGKREPKIYGTSTIKDINERLQSKAKQHNVELSFFQTNSEGALLDFLQSLAPSSKVIINPGALAHTSIALRDCIKGCQLVAIEVHISNIYSREEFRRHSYISDVCIGSIVGLGTNGYMLALQHFLNNE